ncbi:MAG: LPS assembly lipoprotein LptE [Alcaligenaceae bacterium]|nr:LPS assembly lipoprotein LptE [Alcaligenaceae bacterium]
MVHTFRSVRTAQHTARMAVCAGLFMLLAACGFHLKEATPIPFQTIYTNINLNTDFGARLRRSIQTNSPDSRFVDSLSQADVYLNQMSNQQKLRQISIDAEGRVEEYGLDLIFTFQVVDRNGRQVLPPTTLTSTREIPYNERVVQAKEGEITRTFQDMQLSLIDQIMRRLSSPEVRHTWENLSQQPIVKIPDDTPAGTGQPDWTDSLPGNGQL